MTETNLNIVLSNALCCSSQLATKVGKLYDTGNICVETEFDKLKLLIDRINTLKCYNFPIITTIQGNNSEFIPNLSFYNPDYMLEAYNLTIQLKVNGTIYTLISDGVNDGFNLIVNKLTELGVLVSYLIIMIDKITELRLELTCNISNISFTVQYGGEFPSECLFINSIVGICPSTTIISAQNCLTEEQANIMMHDIMHQCDICDCQLTT